MDYTQMIDALTLAEKCALLSGKTVFETWDIPRLGLASAFCADGPHGVRKQTGAADHLGLGASQPATCFPTSATLANSWDTALVQQVGAAIGAEASAQDVDVMLGPGLNIKRSPLCGRNFEYFSEDPYLSGKLAAAYIRGMQATGVGACPKHFAVNSQELRRMASNSVVDERTLREIYLTGFEIAVREGQPVSLMSSYNEVNGVYANENRHLLLEILREEWGFEGFVVTDWGGSNNHVAGVQNGSALEMPCPGFDSARQLLLAVQAGQLSEADINARLAELLRGITTVQSRAKGTAVDLDAHHALAAHAAEQSAVLLKNDDALLPLAAGTRVAVIGDFAQQPRYQGAGSSLVNSTRVDSAVDCLGSSGLDCIGFAQGFWRDGKDDAALAQRAVELARGAQVALVFIGLAEINETEGLDRDHLQLAANQTALLRQISEVNPNVVAVLSAGCVVDMSWAKYCKAILHGYLAGQAGAGALLRVVTGAVNPSGKLNETYPSALADTPASAYHPGRGRNAEYREALFVGYRYYQSAGTPVAYPFGHGLSYTTFAYSNLAATAQGVSFDITNTGHTDGAEVAQLYIGKRESGVFRPVYELKGFAKVWLAAGQTQRVSIPFDAYSFRYYNVATQNWQTEPGEYQVYIGASAADIRLEGSLPVAGDDAPCPYSRETLPAYYACDVHNIPDAQFSTLLGHSIPPDKSSNVLNANDTLGQMANAKSGLARFISRTLARLIKRSEAKGKPSLNLLFQYNMPFRAIAKMTNGLVSMEMVDGMVTLVNGRFFKGMGRIIGGFFRNRKANKQYLQQLRGQAESDPKI